MKICKNCDFWNECTGCVRYLSYGSPDTDFKTYCNSWAKKYSTDKCRVAAERDRNRYKKEE